MGLDMYLSKKHYVKNWDHNPEQKFQVSVKLNGKKHTPVDLKKVTYIQEEVGYWRKQNHIHQWFVDNVQGGRDECQSAYVDPTKLQELLDICKKVKEASVLIPDGEHGKLIKDSTVAKELLPCQGGFFFGGEEYDEWYLQGVTETIKILEGELKHDWGIATPEYYYQSSW
jgi:hypothetical protein